MSDVDDLYLFNNTAPQRPPRCSVTGVQRGSAIVIDNGSFHCRVGWAGQPQPQVSFRALLHRPKAKSLPDGSVIVGDYDTSLLRGVDPARSVTKSAFDGPVSCFMDVQEAIFDHGFERLGLGGAGVAHPVVCTEPLLAPPSARSRLAELLFESYGVPSLAFGADAAFAWAHAAPTSRGAAGTGIVACVGHSSSTILPILNGVPVNAAAVRLDVAGLTVTQYLMDLLRVNFPEFGPALGGGIFARSEEVKHALCHVAADYASEAAAYTAVARSCIGRGGGAAASDDKSRNDANGSQASQRRFAPGSTVRVQLPWVPKTVKAGAQPLSEEDIQRREAQRQANADRLRAMAAAKRAAKEEVKAAEVESLEHALEDVRAAAAAGDPSAALDAAGYPSEAALVKALTIATMELRKLRGESVDDSRVEEEEAPEEERFPLLHVPDEELTAEQLKEKRKQRLIRGGELARARARDAKAAAAAAEAAEVAALEQKMRDDPEGALQELRAQKAALLQRLSGKGRNGKHGAPAAMAAGGDGDADVGPSRGRRGGEAARQRLRLMAQAIGPDGDDDSPPAGGQRKRGRKAKAARGDDDDSDGDGGFGDREEDWQVYKDMDGDSDSEAERQRAADEAALAKVRAHLAVLAPDDEENAFGFDGEDGEDWDLIAGAAELNDAAAVARWNTAEAHQMLLSTERIRAPELLFQPTAVLGLPTVGLPEAVAVALRRASPDVRAALMVASMPLVLSGGCAALPGCATRFAAEVTSILPVGCAPAVRISGPTPWEDAWKGAAAHAAAVLTQPDAVTRAQWMEEGGARLKHTHGIHFRGMT